jgi:dephospho-CoA kinase
MFILGLTGSIGMGKSATARMFAEAGVPVHDADATVHRLYEGEAVAAIEQAFPGTTAGKVDREKLAARVLDDPAAVKRLEAIVHPLVRESASRFLTNAAASAAVRNRSRSARRRGGGGVRAGGGAARSGAGPAGHDAGEASGHIGQAGA